MLQDICIGKSHWILETPYSMHWEADAEAFTKPNPETPSEASRHFRVIPTEQLPGVGGIPSSALPNGRAWLQDGLEAREYVIHETGEPFAVYAEGDEKHALVFLHAARPELFLGDRYFFNRMALERNLLEDGQVILHSCYIIYNGQAILFTAPSGTGKSTQGDLWAETLGAEVINGDRSILAETDGVWKAYGLPFAGTSGICKNRQAPIRAIVYLHQAPENQARLMEKGEAFMKLYEQVTINNWNPAATAAACGLLEKIAAQVPVYSFGCTKYPEAVHYLKAVLDATENG